MTAVRALPIDDLRVFEFVALSQSENQVSHLQDVRHVRWKYEMRPDCESLAIDLVDGVTVVGRLWLSGRSWIINGHNLVVGQPSDLLIATTHREFRNLATLVRETFRMATKYGNLYYHGSNPNSEPLYRTFFKRQPTLSLGVCICPLRPLRLMGALFGGVSSNDKKQKDLTVRPSLPVRIISYFLGNTKISFETMASDSEVRSFEVRFHSEQPASADRRSNWRSWRFHEDSGTSYLTKWIRVEKNVVGYVTWTDARYRAANVRVIVDIAIQNDVGKRETIAIIANLMRGCALDGLLFMGNAANRTLSRFMRLPFVKVPKRLLPQSVNFYFRKTSDGIDNDADSEFIRRSYLTLYDLDFF